MKIGNIYKVEKRLIILLNIESYENAFKVRFRELLTGIERTEMFKKDQLVEYKLNFVKETKYHYLFDHNGIKYEFKKINMEDFIDNLKESKWPSKKCKPVYINVFPDNIKAGTKVKLQSKLCEKIFYSIDDSEFVEYKKEIIITKDCNVTAYAIQEGCLKSKIKEFKFKIKNRVIKIYFSPSRQINNKGIKREVYSNERTMMNLLTDKIINKLKKYEVICYRNNPDLFIKDWLQDGINKNIDCHFAIHTNDTSKHDKKGPEIWVDKNTSPTYSIAKLMYKNLYEIYHDNKNDTTYRGIKFAKGRMMECNDEYFKFGFLLELGYHDNEDDCKWMQENIDEIAENLKNTLIEYFQLEVK